MRLELYESFDRLVDEYDMLQARGGYKSLAVMAHSSVRRCHRMEHTHTHARTHTYTRTRTHTHTRSHTHTHTHTHKTHTHAHTHAQHSRAHS